MRRPAWRADAAVGRPRCGPVRAHAVRLTLSVSPTLPRSGKTKHSRFVVERRKKIPPAQLTSCTLLYMTLPRAYNRYKPDWVKKLEQLGLNVQTGFGGGELKIDVWDMRTVPPSLVGAWRRTSSDRDSVIPHVWSRVVDYLKGME